MSNYKEPVSCKFTSGVNCPEEGRDCERRGFNPEVAAQRLEAIHKKLGVST